MQLDGIGGSTVTFTNNTNTSNQAGVNREKPVIEERVKLQQPIKPVGPIEQKEYTRDEVVENVEKANKMLAIYDRRFEISIHDKTNRVMVKVIDSTTDEIIREIPSEKILDMVAGFMEVAGIIVDKKI